MTGQEFRDIRLKLGLTAEAFARLLGYRGSRASVQVTIRRYESEVRPIPPAIATLAKMYEQHGTGTGKRQ
jgi:transcriptional regulator with XRE-family HTH domain